MRRLLREPLVQFLLLGAGLFLIFSLAGNRGSDRGEIVITRGEIEHLAAGFTRTWQRAPTAEELEGLVNARIREEVYYREALAMGLDRDDSVIRRRLQQKLEFIGEDVTALAEPTEAELEAYFLAHPGRFRAEERYTFAQIYLNPDRHPDTGPADAAALLARLRAAPAAEASSLGDPFMLGSDFEAMPASEVTKTFGDKFAAALGDLRTGEWGGPVESGYGQHLVLVSARTEGRQPAFAEARDAVLRAFVEDRRVETNEQFYQGLLQHYTVTIEQPSGNDQAAAR